MSHPNGTKDFMALEPAFSTEHGTLYQGDCLALMEQMESESIDLIFADPPFNLKKMYDADFDDNMSEEDYVSWSRQWITGGARLLRPGGAFFLYNIPKWNTFNAMAMTEAGLDFRHWIAVDIKLGLPIPNKLYPAHYSLLYYTKGKPKTFTRPRLPIEVCRHCGKDIKDYGGHRNKLHPDGINLSDVWNDIPPVRHKRTKNRGANELSEKMLDRVLTIASVEGDTVFDPFGGSGTTYAVAERMHRDWVGVELGDIQPIINRLDGSGNVIEMPDRGDGGRKVAKPKPEANSLF